MRLIDADALANVIETECPALNFAALLAKGWVLSLIRDKANTPTVEQKQEWISVNDRLPIKNGRCLIAVKSGAVTTASFANDLSKIWMEWEGSGWWNMDCEDIWIRSDVTHWMPMPEPPERGETDA